MVAGETGPQQMGQTLELKDIDLFLATFISTHITSRSCRAFRI